ncbi:uncharacterized protein F4807DRAFT_255554 [Annulohypoxylon truncatum]|uniref:uncharacterized protein n=1 Tax=Annulohypoxylon truncatum TaxID=327061 RepID=UPI0020072E31|nr:uncharacterized protein F4807DRAFT_255554 [Annulohypoxylon truncatum]KAI1213222.1 hypothetical protein F4807DRAFT_255554 [Annulohypoxylon truncatum]
MATAVEANSDKGGELDGDISPRNKDSSTLAQSIPSLDTTNNGLGSLNMRADPDAQATVTDFLDFTEYLPSDMMRSLTLIGNLDQAYLEASATVNGLTATWGKLPTLPADQRPAPARLRQEISENLNRAVSSRVFSHAEAVRIHENVIRHYNRAKTIHAKLQAMRDNFPTAEEQKSPTQVKSPQMVRTPKITLRLDSNGQKIQRPPRITVPGEVLAPYEIDFNSYSSLSDESSDDEEEEEDMPVSPPRQVAAPSARIKVVKPPKSPKPPKQKIPKPPRPPRASMHRSDNTIPMMSTSTALAQLKPPPENAVPGSADAPWLQLTPYELAKLRKRMKKNAVWNPSDTMIARELKNLGRGVEAYRAAQKQAEEEGKPFEAALPAPVVDAESGTQHPPEGAISAEALTADEVQLSNRGMKLNEAKKLKRESMARIAAEEAEESARKMVEAARMFLSHEASPSVNGGQDRPPEASQSQGKASKPKTRKRKRNSMSETPVSEKPEAAQSLPANQPASQPEKPQLKRTKTETPVPLPQLTPRPPSVPPPPPASTVPSAPTETPVPVPHLGKISQAATTSKTPVPVPLPVSSDTSMVTTRSAASSSTTSPAPPSSVTTTVPVKPPAETPVPLPPKTSTTPIPPPARELPKRETRQNLQQVPAPTPANPKQPSSRGNTPTTTSVTESQPASARRPTSRGKAASQEPPPTLAAERPRRASTARNTPAPELRQPSKRTKRPAPGVVTTNSGGTSAIGKRKAAPRKKAIGKKEKGANQEVEGEVDDDGNVIDPDEPRYCLCNGVSFGTMIQCDNVDVSAKKNTKTPARDDKTRRVKKLTENRIQNCKQEWFHLGCVGLTEIPARTTKWYCPECRIALNIGGRGEVNSRGVRM